MVEPQARLVLKLSVADVDALTIAATRADATLGAYIRAAALRVAAQDAHPTGAPAHAPDPPPSRRSLRPRRSDAKMLAHEMVRQLTTHLGIRLLTLTLAADAESVTSWADERNPPPEPYERRLQAAHGIWEVVCSVESPNTVRTWWMGMKDGLDGLSPAEAIALDQYDDARAVARYFLEAG